MLLNEIRDYLNGIAGLLDFPAESLTFVVRTGKMPDTPDACIALEEAPGLPAVRAMGASLTAPLFERPTLNVWVRGPRQGTETGRMMAQRVHEKLDGAFDLVLGGVRYAKIEALGGPPFLDEQDRNERDTFVCSYIVTKQRSPLS